jgi:beta-N-acetylhexosaminidase
MRIGSGCFRRELLSAAKRSGGLLLRFLLLFTILVALPGRIPGVQAEADYQSSKVDAVLSAMTPEERVGQLFLVTFQGTNTETDSQIYDLIVKHHIGGVVLQADNDNFVAGPDTLSGAHQLISSLQAIEAQGNLATPDPNGSGQPKKSIYVPLFIGISQEGDGTPYDQILSGVTSLPSEMAIGASWDTDLARQVGSVLGSELSAMGFNLLLGPSLDVVESPNPSAKIDLGTRVFGGDPYWVGELGKAFISGVHSGSNSRMAVIAKHFPGRGSSDRSPEEEVPTVRKSLEQLKQIELSPFFAVTQSDDPGSVANGLLVSHIRYQGFQGNIRATTRPLSLDASALKTIISLPEFSSWRQNDGLMVSDALGSQAIRDFYIQGGETFQPRSVARDAFIAGNDLLYLGNISQNTTEEDNYSATINILDFFTQQYKLDPGFAQAVDDAVTRILAQKFAMYDLFTMSNVLTPTEGLAKIGASSQVSFDVAHRATTLISPDPQNLNSVLPLPPGQNDRIVFLTDTQTYQQCSSCPPQDALSNYAFQDAVEKLYGLNGSGQVISSKLSSYPFTELELMLNGESKENIEPSLERATWIVISLADVSNGQVELLRRFFAERPNLLRGKNVILYSFTAPYYLDATDISKLTAYYGMYSKQPAFIEAAARLLFQQAPEGASPVSIPAVQYDLITATSPDPNQVIPLSLDDGRITSNITPTAESTLVTVTVEPTEIPLYKIGDRIAVQAGPIIDTNQHIVPDGTVVRFTMSTRDQEGGILQQVDTTTTDGVARASFSIDKPGKVEISATSEPAMVSGVVQFDASQEAAAVTIVVPTVSVTPAPPTETATPPPPQNDLVSPDGHPRIGAWLLVLIAVFGSAVLTYWAASRIFSPRWGLRWALCIFLGGMLGYNYLALDFPGAATWVTSNSGSLGVLLLVFIGEMIGVVAALIWMRLVSAQASRAG